ncbi:MAG: hypothetical protein ACJAUG_001818 [Halioglobus sp.]|jgi:hypothetical protein
MSEFHLSHIALVGARMETFSELGINNRNELKMRRICPAVFEDAVQTLSSPELKALLIRQFPLWIHNIIADPDFPKREQLLMPLRRFEGELKDKKADDVVSAVMTAGFKSESLNPLDLPKEMSMQQRCAMVAQITVWQEAYQSLENDILEIMSNQVTALATWCAAARQPGRSYIEEV